jgi:hypothetical protein
MKEILIGSIIGLFFGIIFAINDYFKERGTKKEREHKKKESIQKEVFSRKEQTLTQLKDKGILTEQEYEEKLKKLVEDNLEKSLEDYNEYKQLKYLYNDGILTKDEFESKVEFLKEKLRSNTEGSSNKNRPSEGMILVTDTDLNYGFTDILGNQVIDNKYEYAENFSEGLALVKLNGKFGFIDKKGNVVIDLQFEGAKSFQNGFAKVKRKKNTNFVDINKKGERVY